MKPNYQVGDAFYYNKNKDLCIIIEINYFSDIVLCWDIYLSCGFSIHKKKLIAIPINRFMSIIDTTIEPLEYNDVYTYTKKLNEETHNICFLTKTEKVSLYEIGVVVFDSKFKVVSYYDDSIELDYFHQLQQLNRIYGYDMPLRKNKDAKSSLFAKAWVENYHKKNNN